MAVYVFVSDSANVDRMKKARKTGLDKGLAVFGWGYKSGFDLNNTTDWSEYGKTKFLKNINSGDRIIYVNYNADKNIAEDHYGDCTIMNVAGEYSFDNDILNAYTDFGHTIPIDPSSVISFPRNHPSIHRSVSKSLKPRKAYQRLYDEDKLEESLNNFKNGLKPNYFENEIDSAMANIIKSIQTNHPAKYLESFIQPILEKIYSNKYGDSVFVKNNGSGYGTDYGADLIITYKENLDDLDLDVSTNKEHKVVVQVKSYTWSINDDNAIEQCKTAMKEYTAEYALLITTAAISEDFDRKINEHNENKENGQISLIDGEKIAQLYIKYMR
ncbi:MAG: restriction endonuclease [Alphaproteobacteria bacterium]|jgi:restriction endonuclease Mrr|nr:restriction endonuclease [Alphaproteobacteria bacterium]